MKQGKFWICSWTRIPTEHQVRFCCELLFHLLLDAALFSADLDCWALLFLPLDLSINISLYNLNSSWWFRSFIAGIAIVVMVGEWRHLYLMCAHQTRIPPEHQERFWAGSHCCRVPVGASFSTDIDLWALLFVLLDPPCQFCSTGDLVICGLVVKSPVLQSSWSWRARDENVFWLRAYKRRAATY